MTLLLFALHAYRSIARTDLLLAAGSGAPTDIFAALDKIKAAGDTLFTHFLPIGLTRAHFASAAAFPRLTDHFNFCSNSTQRA